MKHNKFQKELGATTACTKRIMQETKGIGQKYRKVATKDCFIFDSWFSLKKLSEAAMEFGAELIGTVKKNTKIFCQDTIEKLTKDWPGGSYLVLSSKPMVPGVRPLIAIGYKYNVRKVLSFIVTDNTGSAQTGLPYLYKYLYQFTNVDICPVACPLVMSKFFSAVNGVDSHNK